MKHLITRRLFIGGATAALTPFATPLLRAESSYASPSHNPYLTEVMRLPDNYRRHDEDLVDGAESEREDDYKKAKYSLVFKYSWSIPTDGALAAIRQAASRPGIVDFGAGTGYWAGLLKDRGVDVLAIDNWTRPKQNLLWHWVETGSFEHLPQVKNRAMLLSWPPQGSPMALMALRAWGGKTLIYIGEPAPARGTAEPKFFEELEANWKLEEIVTIPQWFNRNDAVYIYTRK